MVPALVHMYEIQPEASRMFDTHVEWLLDMYEGRYAGIRGYSAQEVCPSTYIHAFMYMYMCM